MDRWFAFRFRKGSKTRFPMVTACMVAPLGVVLPTLIVNKNEAINEAIDRLIANLESMRSKKAR